MWITRQALKIEVKQRHSQNMHWAQVQLIGLSCDSVEQHRKWTEDRSLSVSTHRHPDILKDYQKTRSHAASQHDRGHTGLQKNRGHKAGRSEYGQMDTRSLGPSLAGRKSFLSACWSSLVMRILIVVGSKVNASLARDSLHQGRYNLKCHHCPYHISSCHG